MPPVKGKGADKGAKAGATDRRVAYPEYDAKIFHEKFPDGPLTDAKAGELLGWKEETKEQPFGNDYLFMIGDLKVRCDNNAVPGRYSNRPIYWDTLVVPYAQDMLNKQWQFNMEPCIISRTGLVLDGQHTLIALKLANMLRNGPKKAHWDTVWGEGVPVTINKLVCFGADEDERVINSMNTGKSRSLMDVMYRSEHFQAMKPSDRKVAAKMAESAVKMMWHRTGEKVDAFSPRMTQAEAMEFIEQHPRLVRCVKHIQSEDKEGMLRKRQIPAGYAAAMMYLMASCNSDPAKYGAGGRVEAGTLKWDNWDKAVSFWNAMIAGSFNAVREYLAELAGDGGRGSTLEERLAVVVKAWNAFSTHGNDLIKARSAVTKRAIELDLNVKEEDGVSSRTLVEALPTVGGIDLGDPKKETEAPPEVSNGSHDAPVRKGGKEHLEELRGQHPNVMLIFETLQDKVEDGKVTGKEVVGYKLFGDDAKYLAKLLKRPMSTLGKYEGMAFFSFPADELSSYRTQLDAATEAEGRKVATVRKGPVDEAGNFEFVVEYAKPKKAKPAAGNGKPGKTKPAPQPEPAAAG